MLLPRLHSVRPLSSTVHINRATRPAVMYHVLLYISPASGKTVGRVLPDVTSAVNEVCSIPE